MTWNIVLKISYDGTGYLGWQKTKMGPSIEGILQATLEKIQQEPVVLQAASRTDAGVHAIEQIANFFTSKRTDLAKLKKSLNALLPPSLRVLGIAIAPLEFHPTLDVIEKEYEYQLYLGDVLMPFSRFFAWHIYKPLNLEKMKQAATFFLGEKDFSSFCNSRKNSNYSNKIRKISSIEFIQASTNHLSISIKGNHFLYKMVRNLVGTLVNIGTGKMDFDKIDAILAKRSRKDAGVTAPACGLYLKQILYPKEILNLINYSLYEP